VILGWLNSTGRYGRRCWRNIFWQKFLDELWATKSEDIGLIVSAISFQDFQPMWSWSTNVTERDGQTDNMWSNEHALHYSASHGKNVASSCAPEGLLNWHLLPLLWPNPCCTCTQPLRYAGINNTNEPKISVSDCFQFTFMLHHKFLQCNAMLAWYTSSSCVYVCLSQASTGSKQINLESRKPCHMIAQKT